MIGQPSGSRFSPWTVAFVAVLSLSCSSGDGGTDPGPIDTGDAIASVVVAPATFQIDIGQTQALSATVRNGRNETVARTVTWSSANNAIATVDASGLVSAVGDGVVIITASTSGVSGTSTGTVVDPNPPGPPSALTATPVSNTEVDLTWADNSSNEDEFRIEREVAGGGGAGAAAVFEEIARIALNSESFSDTGLDPVTTYAYRVRACNANGCSDFAVGGQASTFATLQIQTTSLPGGTTNVAYAGMLTAVGGSGDFTWTVTSGTLPAGLTLSDGGAISGTPTAFGDFAITFQVASGGQVATVALTIQISEQIVPPEVTTTELPSGAVGTVYGVALQATRGDGSYTWEITAGSLPGGLSLSAAGILSGVPTTVGDFPFTVRVTSIGMTGDATLSITVFEAVEITTTSVPDGVEGAAYSTDLAATGGDGTYTWAVSSGVLPAGVELSDAGTLAGTPTESGSFEFTAEVTSGDGQTAEATLTLVIIPAVEITTTSLADGVFQTTYDATLEATGGDGSFTWTLSAGSLPPGLALDGGTGAISGDPTEVGTFAFTARVESGDGQVVTAELSITVGPAAVTITTSSLPAGTANATYTATLVATGGDGTNYNWTVTSGALPTGLSLDETTGAISGTPTVVGTVAFTVQVNSSGETASVDLSIDIVAEILAPLVTTASLPDGLEGAAYNQTLVASRGDGSYAWTISAGSLPTDLSLAGATGVISGSPSAAGTFNFTVQVTSATLTGTQDLSIEIAGLLAVTTISLPGGQDGMVYSQTLTSTGGTTPITWSITAGSLPTGLSLAGATGVISGSPSAGTFNFTVQALSNDSQTATAALSIVITGGTPVSFSNSLLMGGNIGVAYSDQIDAATGGTGSYVYTVSNGSLPAGLGVNATTGAITGSPGGAGVSFFELTAASGGSSATAIFAITISTTAPAAFNMWAVNVADQIPSAAVITQLNASLASWESVVTGDVPDYAGANGLPSTQCGGFGALVNDEAVDDFMVLINIGPIDGAGSTLGSGGPCGWVRPGVLPKLIYGQLTLDSVDLAGLGSGTLFSLIWHEIGHAMGIGTLWDDDDYLLITNAGMPTPTYTGAQAVTEWQTLGGTGDVPVEQDGGAGTADVHWDEETFDTEMMTGFIESTISPISRMTIGSLQDLQWTVNLAAADAYVLPACSPACLRLPRAPREPFDFVVVEDLFLSLPNGGIQIFQAPSPSRRGR